MTAGGSFHGKVDPKKTKFFGVNKSNEILSDSQTNTAPKKFSLSGILGLNQTVEINSNTSTKTESWGKEFLGNINNVQEQERTLLNQRQNELENTIKELQTEIRNLTKSTDNLNQDVQNVALENIPEVSEYQINFLTRIKNFIINFRKNISEASSWLESFSKKKRKRNYFWSMAKSKKGGEQYLMSSEHSASRSVN
jgi:molecular chaperone GrpE (heat shock protein)